jgi:hypothetical protein
MPLKSLDNITVILRTIDVLKSVEKTVVSGLVQEVPTKISSIRFQTSKPFVTGSIKFYLNGLKEKQSELTEISTTIFEISEPILTIDDFEVEYLELI